MRKSRFREAVNQAGGKERKPNAAGIGIPLEDGQSIPVSCNYDACEKGETGEAEIQINLKIAVMCLLDTLGRQIPHLLQPALSKSSQNLFQTEGRYESRARLSRYRFALSGSSSCQGMEQGGRVDEEAAQRQEDCSSYQAMSDLYPCCMASLPGENDKSTRNQKAHQRGH